MAGIKETTEALVGVNEVALVVAERLKDGVQLSDFEAFYSKFTMDTAFKAKLQAAYENYQAIPAEVSDLDLFEGISLVQVQVSYVPRLIAAMKKPAVVNPVGE
jgi:hypothetical protein